MNGQIVVVGSLNMDLVVHAPQHPQPGETLLGSDFRMFPGGKGANQAVAAARLGAPVTMIGRVGADAFGDQLLKALAQDSVDSRYVRRDGAAPTGVALITIDAQGQNTIVVASGANAELTPDDIAASEAAFEGASLLLVQLEVPFATVASAITIARRYGLRVLLNPAPAQLLPESLLAQVDYLIPNTSELALLANARPGEPVERLAQRLRDAGARQLLVTMGEAGVLLVADDATAHIPALRVAAVDTTAAGDAFVGGLAVALREGRSLADAARWGNAAGAVAVMRHGAQPSLATRAELEALLL